jgi:hypothetical protein
VKRRLPERMLEARQCMAHHADGSCEWYSVQRDVLRGSATSPMLSGRYVYHLRLPFLLILPARFPVVATWDIRSLNRPFASVRYLAFITFLGECM